jgi:hypothetical protein
MVSGERYNPVQAGTESEGRGSALRDGSAPRPSLTSPGRSRETVAMNA